MAFLNNHNRRPGVSKYPIKPGVIVRLLNPRKRWNKKLNTKLEHDVYLWFQRFSIKGKGRIQPKKRRVAVALFYVPKMKGAEKETIIVRKYVLKESLTIALSKGYTLISENATFNYTEEAWTRAYERIGLV